VQTGQRRVEKASSSLRFGELPIEQELSHDRGKVQGGRQARHGIRIMRQQVPILGDGQADSSFVRILVDYTEKALSDGAWVDLSQPSTVAPYMQLSPNERHNATIAVVRRQWPWAMSAK
jgi:hypothetical protein